MRPAGSGGLGAWASLGLLGLALLALAPGRAAAYEQRGDTPSVGAQIQLGELEYDSIWADAFDWGQGVAIHVRNAIGRRHAIGISFEQQKFERAAALCGDSGLTDYLQMQTLMADYYIYFRRPMRRCYYAVFSAGFYRSELIWEQDVAGQKFSDVRYPGENFLARAGGGMEHFLGRKLSIDASLSLYYFHAGSLCGVWTELEGPYRCLRCDEKSLTASGQLALGLHVYFGR
jgi:hypothetical protein